MKGYNIARYALALAYLIIGGFNFYKAFVSSADNMDMSLIRTLTLISASYQALLFTFALLILIQPLYVTIKRALLQLGATSLVAITLLILLITIPHPIYRYYYNIASMIYAFQIIYYTFLFRKKYAKCLRQLEDYYNEDEDNRLRWVKISFYLALSIGIITLCMTYLPLHNYIYIVPLIIIFYVFFAIKYYNYPFDFRYVISAVHADIAISPSLAPELPIDQHEAPLRLSEKEQKLQQAIEKWVKEKRYQCDDMSRDDIAGDLGTDRYFLAHFFHNHMKIEFRVWRTQLRIEEAKSLLLQYPDLPISKIGEKVGISDRSNFQKKFLELTGISPKEWRKQNLKNLN